MAKADPERRVAAQNRRARHDYFIEDTVEAGIMLVGSEVKALREGKASIGEAYAADKGGELFLINAYIPEYSGANLFNHEPKRPRKLLIHRREMHKLTGAITRDGMTLVPLDIHFTPRGIAKVLLGLAKGKRKVDKRETVKERDWQRDKARLMRSRG
jgi:SsrA-binding protein